MRGLGKSRRIWSKLSAKKSREQRGPTRKCRERGWGRDAREMNVTKISLTLMIEKSPRVYGTVIKSMNFSIR